MSYLTDAIEALKNELRVLRDKNDKLLEENTRLRLTIEIQKLELERLS